MVSKLIVFACVVLCIYGGLVALVYFRQSAMVYFPTRSIDATPDQIGLQYEDVWLETKDGERVHGWYSPAPDAVLTVLMFHGNGGNISHRLQTLALLHRIGVNSLIIDYRGYGRSEGRPGEQATYHDALAAWQYLLDRGLSPQEIVLFGRSLGGAVAVWLAARVVPGGLILESTFTSVNDMAQHHYPFLPVNLISKFKYDSLALVDDIQSPVLALHSPHDEIVPYELGVRLYQALPGEKSFVDMKGGHNDGFYASGEGYINSLRDFLQAL